MKLSTLLHNVTAVPRTKFFWEGFRFHPHVTDKLIRCPYSRRWCKQGYFPPEEKEADKSKWSALCVLDRVSGNFYGKRKVFFDVRENKTKSVSFMAYFPHISALYTYICFVGDFWCYAFDDTRKSLSKTLGGSILACRSQSNYDEHLSKHLLTLAQEYRDSNALYFEDDMVILISHVLSSNNVVLHTMLVYDAGIASLLCIWMDNATVHIMYKFQFHKLKTSNILHDDLQTSD